MALSNADELEPKRGFFSSLLIFILLGSGIFFAMKYGKPHLIDYYPDAIYIYDFLQTIWSVIVMMGQDIWQHILRVAEQLS